MAVNLLLTGLIPLLSGCYTRVLDRHYAPMVKLVNPRFSTAPKIAFMVSDIQHRCCGKQSEPNVIVDALLSIFKQLGFDDVIQSEKYEPGRINLIVYLLDPEPTTASRWLSPPLNVISMFSLCIIPSFASVIQPIEIHIVDPSGLHVIRSEYVVQGWGWLPLMLVKDGETKGGNYFYTSFGARSSSHIANWSHDQIRQALYSVISGAIGQEDRK